MTQQPATGAPDVTTVQPPAPDPIEAAPDEQQEQLDAYSWPATARAKLALAADGSTSLVLSADAPTTTSEADRTITGMLVPYGPAGMTTGGLLTFAKGSIAWSDPKRVKLLREHDQGDVLGYATELDDRDDGLYGTFHVPEGDNGDRALAEASNGLRDAFSVGVQLDDATQVALRRARPGVATAAKGQLRETSQVSVPAFDDARIPVAAAAGALVVASWSTPTSNAGNPAGASNTPSKGNTAMTAAQRARLAELRALQTRTAEQEAELSTLAELDAANPEPAEPGAPEPGTGAADPGAPPATPQAQAAIGGAALITGSPSTYKFDGSDSLVTDAWHARIEGDHEAGERVRKFNAELADGNPSSVQALALAAQTRDDFDTNDGTGAQFLQNAPRVDLMRGLVDRARPLVSKLTPVPIRNAAPFSIPTVGEFTGVGDHTEGTPHRPAGTLTLGGGMVIPRAKSGAWEVSRELVDASNPAIDRIAARAMLRDYRRESEGVLAALLNGVAPTVGGVDGVVKMRGVMLDAINDDDEPVDVAWLSTSVARAFATELDADDRPQLPFVGPANAVGTFNAGSMNVSVDGVNLYRSAKLDAGTGVVARKEGLLWAESPVLQFRFDEVLGPGVIKLALWAYCGAAILDEDDVEVFSLAPLAP